MPDQRVPYEAWSVLGRPDSALCHVERDSARYFGAAASVVLQLVGEHGAGVTCVERGVEQDHVGASDAQAAHARPGQVDALDADVEAFGLCERVPMVHEGNGRRRVGQLHRCDSGGRGQFRAAWRSPQRAALRPTPTHQPSRGAGRCPQRRNQRSRRRRPKPRNMART